MGARALRVTDQDSRCERELVSPEHPGFPVILSDTITESRSGSAAYPIPLTAVQEYAGIGPVPSLAFRNVAGELMLWEPTPECTNKKIIVTDGQFNLAEDENSNVFDDACIGSITDVDYIAGALQFTNCAGEQKLRLVFFPKADFCSYCSSLS